VCVSQNLLNFWEGREVAGRNGTDEVLAFVGAVAKGLVRREPAAAERDGGAAAESEGLALLVDQLEIPFDAKRAVVENGYLGSSHRFLRNLAKK
jgi:hypothetical protein